ncbi:MAG: hypothetical protein R3D57_16990 [Hyphomicrobiaceae bacterium]
MLVGVRVFIAVLYSLIGLSFIGTTAVLIREFQNHGWLSLATFYSHLFLFFPLFGVVALVAFYTPSCVFLDMYWRHVKFGRARFLFGLLVVAGMAWGVAEIFLASSERSVWEVRPEVLDQDRANLGNCTTSTAGCPRLPALDALENIRKVSQSRVGISELAPKCDRDLLVASSVTSDVRRFCFASTPYLGDGQSRLSTDQECCRAQRTLVSAVNSMAGGPDERSLTAQVHRYTLPFKVFFLLTLLVISGMLAFRRRQLEAHYSDYIATIERGVLVGTVAVLFYPVMSHAFLQSAALLYGSGEGSNYRTTAPLLSFAFGCWALLVLFFFYRRRDKEVEAIGRIGGVVASVVAILKYDLLIDYFIRVAGSGAGITNVVLLGALCLLALLALYYKPTSELSVPAAALAVLSASKVVSDEVDGIGGDGA